MEDDEAALASVVSYCNLLARAGGGSHAVPEMRLAQGVGWDGKGGSVPRAGKEEGRRRATRQRNVDGREATRQGVQVGWDGE
jgi:hypothetical protein